MNGKSFSIPFGIGLKYSMSERLGVTLEWTMHKTFTDYIDDIHGLYPENQAIVEGVNYTDPSGLRDGLAPAHGDQRPQYWVGPWHCCHPHR